MKRTLQVIALLIVAALLLGVLAAQAQGRVCDPFTTQGEAGMVALGAQVSFLNYEAGGPVARTGRIEGYYLQSCWPGAPLPGKDSQAYWISYGAADGGRIVLNRSAFEVISTP